MQPQSYTTHTVTSKDGTLIGYRTFGSGPGLVLVQGTMGTAHNFLQLAEALADTFTVYTPDRRGRGMSQEGQSEYSIQREVEDLEALLSATKAPYVFGLSSGAIIALHGARSLTSIQKLAVYEPPLFKTDNLPTKHLERYESALAEGNIPAALLAGMKAGQFAPPIMNLIPDRLLEKLIAMGMHQEDRKDIKGYASMHSLAPTLHNDFHIVRETAGKLDQFKDIPIPTLLLGGSKSQPYLKEALGALEPILPNGTRQELAGLNHSGAWNTDVRGNPLVVAGALRAFFSQ